MPNIADVPMHNTAWHSETYGHMAATWLDGMVTYTYRNGEYTWRGEVDAFQDYWYEALWGEVNVQHFVMRHLEDTTFDYRRTH
jgi:hypothetical protein